MSYKKIYLILAIFLVVSVCLGGTFAYWTWETTEEQRTEVVFTIEEDFKCAADGGGNITSNDVVLAPASCMNSNLAIKREIKVMPTVYGEGPILMNLWLDINSLGEGLSGSQNFKYALTTNPDSCTEDVVKLGNFYGKTTNENVPLFNYMGYSESVVETYYLYVWLDEKETSMSTMNQAFDLSLNGICTNAPESDAYAVYSEDDNSLRFYKPEEPIEVGDTYNDLTATAVYTGFENTNYNIYSTLPWSEYSDAVTDIVFEDQISPISTAKWFYGFVNVEYIDVRNLNASNVTYTTAMFQNAGNSVENFTIVGLDGWNTSNVTNMGRMFWNAGNSATNWSIGDLSNWDVSSVTDMSAMFRAAGYNSTEWSIGDISEWDVSSVTSMNVMFRDVGNKAEKFDLNLSNWNVSSVTNMSGMFHYAGYSATKWSIGDLSNWDVSNVTNMSIMFCDSGKGTVDWSIGNLSNWDTSKATTMYWMFFNAATNTEEFDIGDLSRWDTSKVTNMKEIFSGAGYNATKWNVGDLSGWNTSSVTNMQSLFWNAGYSALEWNVGDLSEWDVSSVTDMYQMFRGAGYNSTIFDIGDISEWDTSTVTNMNAMFQDAGKNANYTLDLSGWNVSLVTSYGNFNTNVSDKVTPPVWVTTS